MNPVSLVLIVHDHQPIGNFDGVFQQAYADAYEPFLAFLERRPRIRIGLHTSGPLLEWIEGHEPHYVDRLRALVERGQVEPWGAGFYEPILPSIPEGDRRGQIERMTRWLENRLGRRPKGVWLTERVWEPGLASSLAAAGMEYTAVDDAHFVAAGLERDDLWGHFLTEDQGLPLGVFPIHRELRYLVPFAEPDATIALLARVAQGAPGRIAVLGDDGEKFGIWPGTHHRCYEERWLDRFADALESNSWVQILTPSEAIARHTPRGRVYLPTASYHEMQEWALPPAAQERYHLAEEVLRSRFGEAAHDLLRGGHWRSFLTRYPESNRMHKRMLRASRVLERRSGGQGSEETRQSLWRAQCNCPYWHGVFGGLYLPHLRAAVYRELIATERALARPPSMELSDLDLDGQPDAVIETARWAAWIGARGGRLWGLDDRVSLWNYGDTLARRPEAYHRQLREAAVGGGEGKSIHEAVRWKGESRMDLLEGGDPEGRDSFLDRWEGEGGSRSWAGVTFALSGGEDGVTARAAEDGLTFEKRYRPGEDGALEVRYRLSAARAGGGALEVALNLALHVPHADDRWVEVNGARAHAPHWGDRAADRGVSSVAFVDAWAGRRLAITTDRAFRLDRAPIETVSLSEAGAEVVFQGTEARFRFDVALDPAAPWELTFRLDPTPTGGTESRA